MATDPLWPPTPTPMTDPKTGLITPAWILFFQKLLGQASAGAGGSVTHTGALTLDALVLGNGGSDIKVLGTLGTTTQVLHGDAGGVPIFGQVVTNDIQASNVTYAKIQNVSAGSTLLGRGSTGAGAVQEIALDATLTMTGTTLAVASSSVGILHRAIVALTNAQVKALPTTPITLIAAPGSGNRLRPLAVSYSFATGSGAYTNIDATYADLHLMLGTDYVGYGPVDDASTIPPLTLVTSVLGTAATRIFDQGMPPQQGTPVAGSAGYVQTIAFYNRNQQENAALMIAMDNNGTGNLTGGNAANTLTVTIYYAIEAL